MQCLLILKTFLGFAFVLIVDNALNQMNVFVQHLKQHNKSLVNNYLLIVNQFYANLLYLLSIRCGPTLLLRNKCHRHYNCLLFELFFILILSFDNKYCFCNQSFKRLINCLTIDYF
jgi:hypothetical protein